jgi:metallo-beta-lactamase class B
LETLPCDVFLGAHGAYFGMLAKLDRIKAGANDSVWIDPEGYQAAVAERKQAFEAELKRQESGTSAGETPSSLKTSTSGHR